MRDVGPWRGHGRVLDAEIVTVALTFDDGPGKSTAAIVAVLARYRVPATFFDIGVNMAARPELVRDEARDG
jgi:peptidoglycan/xylan/chitin deacetylase (PgdA/CDA1 family)